ncbi:hypothetical protein [Micromonospora sp. HNM0581]|uniref:hypothetical protein n=1 Tax=Micromonospora sp. HNM0581 TaxID=2716341 RepID=UPI001F0F51B3|nr:hypothetical protein [Micromonospora sp. HNM0581]
MSSPHPETVSINYHGRQFRPIADGSGEHSRVATYYQDGDLLWGEFTGGHARRGTLTGRCQPDGSIDFAYCMVLDDGRIVVGECHSTPEILPDGRIVLHETWRRHGVHAASGVSQIEEIAGSPPNAHT